MKTILTILLAFLIAPVPAAQEHPESTWWIDVPTPAVHYVQTLDQLAEIAPLIRPGDLVRFGDLIDFGRYQATIYGPTTVTCVYSPYVPPEYEVGPTTGSFHVPVNTPDGTPNKDEPPVLDDAPLPLV